MLSASQRGIQKWNTTQRELEKKTKNLSAHSRSEINDLIFKVGEEVMKRRSLSLIYDKYGNQLFEKKAGIERTFQIKKSGFSTLVNNNDNNLVPIQNEQDKKSDFISYGSIEGIEQKDLKKLFFNDEDSFLGYNKYLYVEQEQQNLPSIEFDNAIQEVVDYINTKGQIDFSKIDKNFLIK